MRPDDVESLFKNVGGLTYDENQFVGNSVTKIPHDINYLRIISEMYTLKHAEKNTKALIGSNKKLAESTDKHAKAMRYLTTALLIVAGLQVILFAIQLWQSYQ